MSRAPVMGATLLLLAVLADAGNVVYSFTDVAAAHAAKLAEVRCAACGTEDGKVDVWHPDGFSRESVHPGSTSIRLLEIRGGDELLQMARELGLTARIKLGDVRGAAAKQVPPANHTASARGFHDEYHTMSEIASQMYSYYQQYVGTGVEYVDSIGSTNDGAAIPALRLGRSTRKNMVFLQCGAHAREWISPATCMYVVEKLLSDQQSGREPAATLLNAVEVFVVPVLNPDGYRYTWSTNRMWRKNRRSNADGSFGVDLNRNYDDHWGRCGSSAVPSSDTYRGTGPFSEPETRAVERLFADYKAAGYRIQAGIDVHAYGQLILRPYGWILPTEPCPGESSPPCVPPNEHILARFGEDMKSAIREESGKVYTSEHAAELYCAAGGADDWIATETMQANGFCLELRDTGNYGFVLPASEIVPTGQEIYKALLSYLGGVVDGLE
ncbi:hypothetical protein DIPPA_32540 [Diplonema papillatum]|nr:hypothetical protein DIPPA_32540 [Diplonema papillatum]